MGYANVIQILFMWQEFCVATKHVNLHIQRKIFWVCLLISLVVWGELLEFIVLIIFFRTQNFVLGLMDTLTCYKAKTRTIFY